MDIINGENIRIIDNYIRTLHSSSAKRLKETYTIPKSLGMRPVCLG